MDEARAESEHANQEDPRLIQHWDMQAAYLVVTGRYSEARKDWARALEIGQFNYGPYSPKYAGILVHIGQASSVYGDYKTAEEIFRQDLTLEAKSNREGRAVA
jgi:tetratricopeptide (TPR) repeat protein